MYNYMIKTNGHKVWTKLKTQTASGMIELSSRKTADWSSFLALLYSIKFNISDNFVDRFSGPGTESVPCVRLSVRVR